MSWREAKTSRPEFATVRSAESRIRHELEFVLLMKLMLKILQYDGHALHLSENHTAVSMYIRQNRKENFEPTHFALGEFDYDFCSGNGITYLH